jgi:stearoyl-CoA desaturase (delta-9 desaturase)
MFNTFTRVARTLNVQAFIALIVYPIFLFALLYLYISKYGIGATELLLLIVGYYGSNISVGIGLHRLWSHNSFKTNKFIEFILALFTAGTLQGPVLSWASNHYKHHTFTDKEMDPHTPLKFKNRFLGFMWSHIGWMLFEEGSYKSIDRLTMVKLGRNEILRWQLKHYWQIAIFMNTIAPAVLGYLVGGTVFDAYIGYLFIGIGRALQQQATFCVNSLCHFTGTKEYFKGTAGDIWWMAIFLLGENYHNFHHAFPSDYRNGVKWYHFDVHKWIIYSMSVLGLAWDLERTNPVRINAKLTETAEYVVNARKVAWDSLKNKTDELLVMFHEKFRVLEASSTKISKQFLSSMKTFESKLQELKDTLNETIVFTEVSSEKMIKNISHKLQNCEKFLHSL